MQAIYTCKARPFTRTEPECLRYTEAIQRVERPRFGSSEVLNQFSETRKICAENGRRSGVFAEFCIHNVVTD